MNTASEMTRSEREDLQKLARRREKLAKAQADARAAELMADFERQMASVYSWDDDLTWKNAATAAAAAITEADKLVAARCAELGIPEEFRPRLSASELWMSRGASEVQRRQSELRRVAKSHVDQLTKATKHKIEEGSVAIQEQIIVAGLASEAHAFLQTMPTAEELMPVLNVKEVEDRVTQPGRPNLRLLD